MTGAAASPARPPRLRGPAPEALLRAGAAAVLLVCGAVAVAYHAGGLDLATHAAWLPPCPLRAATGLPCPGCGMTRALLALAQLRVGEALALHPFAPLVLLGTLAAALRPGLLARAPSSGALAALAALLALWAARLLDGGAV